MSINRRTDKEDMVPIRNGILLSHKKNETVSSATTWLDLEIIIQSKSERQIPYHLHVNQNTAQITHETETIMD